MRRGRKSGAELAPMREAAAAPPAPWGMKHPPSPPSWLKGEALTRFRRVAYHIHKRADFRAVDIPTLARYCELWATWRAMQEEIRLRGVVTSGQRSVRKPNELLRIVKAYSAELRELEESMGITERGRRRLSRGAKEDDGEADGGSGTDKLQGAAFHIA